MRRGFASAAKKKPRASSTQRDDTSVADDVDASNCSWNVAEAPLRCGIPGRELHVFNAPYFAGVLVFVLPSLDYGLRVGAKLLLCTVRSRGVDAAAKNISSDVSCVQQRYVCSARQAGFLESRKVSHRLKQRCEVEFRQKAAFPFFFWSISSFAFLLVPEP